MIKKLKSGMSSKLIQYQRVWRILRKPTMEEFKTISKVTAIGLLIIGALGFAVAEIMAVLF